MNMETNLADIFVQPSTNMVAQKDEDAILWSTHASVEKLRKVFHVLVFGYNFVYGFCVCDSRAQVYNYARSIDVLKKKHIALCRLFVEQSQIFVYCRLPHIIGIKQ